MKHLKRFVAVTASLAVVGTAVVAFAMEVQRPVEIVSKLTGVSIEELREQKLEGNTYGAIAEGYGIRDEFKEIMNVKKTALIEEKVENGTLSREKADEILAIECDESGDLKIGQEISAQFGKGVHMSQNGEGKQQNMKATQKRLGENRNGNGNVTRNVNGARMGAIK
jgi:hypothetical protein